MPPWPEEVGSRGRQRPSCGRGSVGIPPPFSAALALGRRPKQLLCGDLGRYPSASCRTKLTPTLDHNQALFTKSCGTLWEPDPPTSTRALLGRRGAQQKDGWRQHIFWSILLITMGRSHAQSVWTVSSGGSACELSTNRMCVSDGIGGYSNGESCTSHVPLSRKLRCAAKRATLGAHGCSS
jgi:hypothetical protein